MTELGSRLRMAREEKSMSLDELQNITRIQKRYLVAIEEGKYDIMPGKFYARAFIKQYAEAVGLEPDLLFEEYRNEIPLAYDENLPDQLSRTQSRRSVSPSSSKALEMFPKIITAIFVLAILVLIWFLVVKYFNPGEKSSVNNNNNGAVDIRESEEVTPPADKNKEDTTNPDEEETTPPEEEPISEETVQQEITMESVTGNTTTYNLLNADKFELEVKAANPGRSWIKIANGNNEVLFQGEIKNGEGQKFDLTNDTKAFIRAGDSTKTEIYVNGELLEYELTTTVQNINIQFQKKE
ncbi:RodZ domain-containing protein [Lederbergia wuyishanensis]|uniref:Cytoskeletal protein RodZ n=1 Tax=Lederbergia wuyishanensis TaxID=1347903 RepID=A0ABU0D001_9BACI|nr:RodZ domain-containing protein [Lederbergia wuyishanensis]MCJ8006335.1 helix-turn-helix domain-containing protein [Lederbergia wuyishanensis]MDQ0341704.1 cytoskeletal protein RodZ [Lederbergia wuyishanensis]